MRTRRVEGSLGPVRDRRLPVIPSRWRLPAVFLTAAVCVAVFVVAVLIGIRG